MIVCPPKEFFDQIRAQGTGIIINNIDTLAKDLEIMQIELRLKELRGL
jgi:hypothetical protein